MPLLPPLLNSAPVVLLERLLETGHVVLELPQHLAVHSLFVADARFLFLLEGSAHQEVEVPLKLDRAVPHVLLEYSLDRPVQPLKDLTVPVRPCLLGLPVLEESGGVPGELAGQPLAVAG